MKNKELFIKIILSSIPILLIAFIIVQTNLLEQIRNIKVIGWMTFIFGILLYLSDKFNVDKNIEEDFNYKSAIIIGLFQILSLIPGVSRSGITISAARILNFKRFDAAKISFLMSIPTLGAVSVFGLKNIFFSEDISFSLLNLLSIFLSFYVFIDNNKIFLKIY